MTKPKRATDELNVALAAIGMTLRIMRRTLGEQRDVVMRHLEDLEHHQSKATEALTTIQFHSGQI